MHSRKILGLIVVLLSLGTAGCGSQEQGPQKALPGDYSGPPGGGGAATGGAPAGGASGSDGSPMPAQRAPQ